MDEVGRIKLLKEMSTQLQKRAAKYRIIQDYRSGECPIPESIARAQVTNAYRMLMAFSQTNYGRLIIKAAKSRLEVAGIRAGDKDIGDQCWQIWQANHMDALSARAHDAALTHGRAFAIAWPSDDGIPTITIENPATVIVKYADGQPYVRVAALRQWTEDSFPYATLYLPDGVYRYIGQKDSVAGPDTDWLPRETPDGQDWEVPNPAGDVLPVVEISTNCELDDSCYGAASGDFESCRGLLDRINVLEFLRLVIAFTSGFPIRAVMGERILRDDEGKDLPPFKLAANVIAQFEKPDVKIEQIEAADLKSFGEAIDHDVETLAGITQTPAYYLRSVPIQNVSADAIRASDSPLNARVDDHKPELGEGWEELLRVAALMLPEPVEVPADAEIRWVNRENRSLSERADAATKLSTVMPWQAVAETCFDATQDQIARWEAMRAADSLNGLLSAPATAVPAPIPAPA